jgi:predicted nucleotide-binding protein
MNLTLEQRDLLKLIVAQYDAGQKGEFLFSPTMDATILIFLGTNGSKSIEIDGDETDFAQLAKDDLITLGRRGENIVGKVTELGIQAVKNNLLDTAVTNFIVREINRGKGRVFIGHGHSHAWKDFRDFLEERLKLTTDDFNREPTAGYSTTEVLQQKLEDASFAFLVMTGEDNAGDGSLRARENVVHEVGLFQGRLGLRRAIVLLEDGCSEFSNINGLTTIRFPKNNILSKSEEIRKVLEREKII